MKKRKDVLVEYTWNMTDMLCSDEAWETLYGEVSEQLGDFEAFRGRLSESAETLYGCLKLDDEISQKVELLYVYGRQQSDVDTDNQFYQQMADRAQTLSNRAAELTSFLVPEILSMDEEVLADYMRSDCGIAHFDLAVRRILAKKKHTLSADLEALLAQSRDATQGASQIFYMFNNADVRFPSVQARGHQVEVTHGSFIGLMQDANRQVRRDAFEALYSRYGEFRNTLAAVFGANVKQAVFYARARHYPSSRAHVLADNEIPEAVYDNLLAAVREALPLLHRYVDLRKRALGLDELHMYDLYVPMVSDLEKKVTFDEAGQMVTEGLKPLGEEYLSLLRKGFEERWIDVYENEGKRSGAYSWGAYGSHPYVLLNYSDTFDDVFTLAHEMGHALHSWYSDQNQPYTYAGYKIFVAEVASTCNEALLIRHLLARTEDRKERAYLINHFLESFRTTLFRQTMFAEFEMAVHKKAEAGETLTAEALCGMYRELNVDYYGPGVVVDRQIDCEWSRIPHFYTPFYVYQYATGFSAAVAISSRLLAGEEGALAGYRRFLSGGSSAAPIELLKRAGVDMSTAGPVKEALRVFAGLLEEMDGLIG